VTDTIQKLSATLSRDALRLRNAARRQDTICFCKTMPSPVGELMLVAGDAGLSAIIWESDEFQRAHIRRIAAMTPHPVLLDAEGQLDEYFAGERRAFDLPLDFVGTAFQCRVWAALLTIPYGETRSYGQIAAQIGHPKAVRAVGAANGRNPLSIVAPCHRVIGADGTLTGFGGGLAAKAVLLRLEGVPNDPRGALSGQLDLRMDNSWAVQQLDSK